MEPQVHENSRPKAGHEVSYSDVLMVQHLIEWCILLCMERDQCVRSLAKYARVKPVITITVWNELEKNNPDFFAEYARNKARRQARSVECMLEDATVRLCTQSLSDSAEGGVPPIFAELAGVSCR